MRTRTLGQDIYGQRGAVLETDIEGHFKKWAILQGSWDLRNFAVSDSGETYVLQDRKNADAFEQVILIYDRAGKLSSTKSVDQWIDKICWSDQGLVGIGASSMVVGLERPGQPATIPYPGFSTGYVLFVEAMTDGRIMVADAVDAEIRVVRPSSGETVASRPDHPKIKPDRTEMVGALYPITTAPDGHIVAGTGAYKRGGATILDLDSFGEIQSEYYIVLPVISPEPGWKGFLNLDSLAVSDGQLIVLDHRGIIARYDLKR